MNAANEIAVGAFRGGEIGFLDIAPMVEETISHMNGSCDLVACANDDAVEWAQIIDGAARRVSAQVM